VRPFRARGANARRKRERPRVLEEKAFEDGSVNPRDALHKGPGKEKAGVALENERGNRVKLTENKITVQQPNQRPSRKGEKRAAHESDGQRRHKLHSERRKWGGEMRPFVQTGVTWGNVISLLKQRETGGKTDC